MSRHRWAIVALVLFAIPTLAADPPGEPASPSPELRRILQRFDEMERTLAKIDEAHTRLVEHTANAISKDILELREFLRVLRADVDQLQKIQPRSLKQDVPLPGSATIVLENQHSYYVMEAVVNGTTHTINPGNSKTVSVNSGRVDIQVMQTDANVRARTLQPGEIKTVTMR